jgi:hypothetical protein
MNNKPNFELMYDLVEEIGNLVRDEILAKAELEFQIAKVCQNAVSGEGKSPSMDYIKTAIVPTDENVQKARRDYAEKSGKLENKKSLFRVLLAQVDVYRTDSANQRVLPT